jgi:hypothetical protein
MSKKNKPNQQTKSGREGALELANLAIAKTVSILLPQEIKKEALNLPLMEGYLRTKMKDKKITIGQTFVTLYLGKEHNFIVSEIDGIKANSIDLEPEGRKEDTRAEERN